LQVLIKGSKLWNAKQLAKKQYHHNNNYTEIKGANLQLNGHQIQKWTICKMERPKQIKLHKDRVNEQEMEITR